MSVGPLSICLCLVMAAAGCAPKDPPALVSSTLSSNDVFQIESAVRQEIALRSKSDYPRRIKSITVTTNNQYESYRHLVSEFTARAKTNAADRAGLRKIEARMRSISPRPAVDVWYADKNAHWGEAGCTVEKGSNGWSVTAELFR